MSAPPRYATPRDPSAKTFGPKTAKLAKALGMPYMPWQHEVADTALELDGAGEYRYNIVVLTIQRRAGKTSLLKPVFAHRGLTVPRAGLWLTAQLRQDAADTWGDFADTYQDSPLGTLIQRRNTNGSETVTMKGTRSKVRIFNALSRTAMHGKYSDAVLTDEAFAFTADQGAVILQAVLPTMATRPGAQLWIVSTAGTAASTWLREYVRLGRGEDRPERMAYFEWSIPEDTEDLTDIDLYARHHPAIGHTIRRDALEAAAAVMKPSEFARAYGNFWTSSDEWVIAPAVWEAARTYLPLPDGTPLAYGAEVRADRSGGCIVAAGFLEDGRAALEVVDERPGIGWMAPRLLELIDRHRPGAVVIDPGSPAAPVHRALTDARRYVPLVDAQATQLMQAHGELMDGLAARTLTHRSCPELDAAVRAASTRQVRETTVLSRLHAEDGTSPALLLAGMLAHHGLLHPLPSARPSIT